MASGVPPLRARAPELSHVDLGWEAPACAVRLQRVLAGDPSPFLVQVGEALAVRGVCGMCGGCYDGEKTMPTTTWTVMEDDDAQWRWMID